jgi:ribosome-associated translation inhibitor RaiA
MKITYSHLAVEYRKAIEREFARHVEKLDRLLKHYDPELVGLHSSLEKVPRKEEVSFSLNLTFPTCSLHSTGVGVDALAGAKVAFAEIEVQVKKHQQKLRKDYVWKRKRGRGLPKLGEVASGD